MTPRSTAAAAAATAALLAAPLATPAASSAAIPNPSTKLIVLGTSIGGLKLGMTNLAMTKAWGAPSTCNAPRTVCSYYARAGGAKAVVRYTRGVVTTISLQSAPKTHAPEGLKLFHDDIGVHLTLPSAQLQQAYPTGSWHRSDLFVIPGPKTAETVIATTKGTVTGLMIRIAPDKLNG